MVILQIILIRRVLNCVISTIITGFLLQVPVQAQQPLQLQPFTEQTNYMSLRGYSRWQQHQQTGVWPALVVSKSIGFFGGDVGMGDLVAGIALAQSVKDNAFAIQHIVIWSNAISSFDYRYGFEQRYIYDVTRATLTLEEREDATEPWNVRRIKRNVTDAQVFTVGARSEALFKQAAAEQSALKRR